jgi:hypothetical protein
MTDPYEHEHEHERVERDTIVTTNDSGYGAGAIVGAIIVALLVLAAIWWVVGGGLTVNNTTTNNGGTTVNPAVPSVTVPSMPGASGGAGSSTGP